MQQREQNEKSGWDALVRQTCKPVMRDIIAGYTVDELCSLYDLDRDPRVEIAASMRDQVRAQIRKWGLDLIGGGISNLVPPDEVIEQRIAHWQAHLQKEIEILEARAEAREKHLIEHARARAEKELIMRITEVYEQLEQLGPERRKVLIALRLLAAIDQAKTGPDSSPGTVPEIQATLGPLARGRSATGGKK
jgi:regulator of protease activity HflC (stomatin/prohibitin superfamily)